MSCAHQQAPRRIEKFTKNWLFMLGDSTIYSRENYDDGEWRKLDLPHDWSIEGDFSENNPMTYKCGALPSGIGWYRKHFDIASTDLKGHVFINFDGIYMNSIVYINGKRVGYRPNGYVSFAYDITKYLHRGSNVVAVRVDNGKQPNSRWYTGSGNTEAETLQKQRDGIINLENGIKSANVKFCIPYADENIRLEEMDFLARKAEETGLGCQHTIFRGSALPQMPSNAEFDKVAQAPGVGLYLGLMHDFDSQPFIVDAENSGVLVAGFDRTVRSGLLSSIFASLRGRKDSTVIFYSSKSESDIAGVSLPSNFILKDISWDFADLDVLVNENKNVFLIIDTFDYARRIAPPTVGAYRRPGTPETPWDIIKRVADPLSPAHAKVILFVENYRRFANTAKELFNLFDLRIGFGLDEDEAGNFAFSGSMTKLKGLQSLTKAVFVDRTKGGVAQFVRPFVNHEPNIEDESE